MRVITKNNHKGFTLIETILACVILCASVLVLGAITTRSLSAVGLNRQHQAAAALAEKQLVLIDYIGISDFLRSGHLEGDTKQQQTEYHWAVSAKHTGIDNLYEVKVTIGWTQRNRNYNVSVYTKLNGEQTILETAGL